MKPVLAEKLERLEAGEDVVVSDADLDVLEATPIGKRIRTVSNPNRVGTLDLWLASIREPKEAA